MRKCQGLNLLFLEMKMIALINQVALNMQVRRVVIIVIFQKFSQSMFKKLTFVDKKSKSICINDSKNKR